MNCATRQHGWLEELNITIFIFSYLSLRKEKKISIDIRKHKEKNVSMLYNLMPEIDISEATTLIDFNFQKSGR